MDKYARQAELADCTPLSSAALATDPYNTTTSTFTFNSTTTQGNEVLASIVEGSKIAGTYQINGTNYAPILVYRIVSRSINSVTVAGNFLPFENLIKAGELDFTTQAQNALNNYLATHPLRIQLQNVTFATQAIYVPGYTPPDDATKQAAKERMNTLKEKYRVPSKLGLAPDTFALPRGKLNIDELDSTVTMQITSARAGMGLDLKPYITVRLNVKVDFKIHVTAEVDALAGFEWTIPSGELPFVIPAGEVPIPSSIDFGAWIGAYVQQTGFVRFKAGTQVVGSSVEFDVSSSAVRNIVTPFTTTSSLGSATPYGEQKTESQLATPNFGFYFQPYVRLNIGKLPQLTPTAISPGYAPFWAFDYAVKSWSGPGNPIIERVELFRNFFFLDFGRGIVPNWVIPLRLSAAGEPYKYLNRGYVYFDMNFTKLTDVNPVPNQYRLQWNIDVKAEEKDILNGNSTIRPGYTPGSPEWDADGRKCFLLKGNYTQRSDISRSLEVTCNTATTPYQLNLNSSDPRVVSLIFAKQVIGNDSVAAYYVFGTKSIDLSKTFSLIVTWDKPGDIDLHVWDPSLNHSSYKQLIIPGGILDRDDRTGTGPETFTSTSTAGRYRVAVNCYTNCAGTKATLILQYTNNAGQIVNTTKGIYAFTAANGNSGYPLNASSLTASWWRAFDVIIPADSSEIQADLPDNTSLNN